MGWDWVAGGGRVFYVCVLGWDGMGIWLGQNRT